MSDPFHAWGYWCLAWRAGHGFLIQATCTTAVEHAHWHGHGKLPLCMHIATMLSLHPSAGSAIISPQQPMHIVETITPSHSSIAPLLVAHSQTQTHTAVHTHACTQTHTQKHTHTGTGTHPSHTMTTSCQDQCLALAQGTSAHTPLQCIAIARHLQISGIPSPLPLPSTLSSCPSHASHIPHDGALHPFQPIHWPMQCPPALPLLRQHSTQPHSLPAPLAPPSHVAPPWQTSRGLGAHHHRGIHIPLSPTHNGSNQLLHSLSTSLPSPYSIPAACHSAPNLLTCPMPSHTASTTPAATTGCATAGTSLASSRMSRGGNSNLGQPPVQCLGMAPQDPPATHNTQWQAAMVEEQIPSKWYAPC